MKNIEDVLKDFDRRLSSIEAKLSQSAVNKSLQSPNLPNSENLKLPLQAGLEPQSKAIYAPAVAAKPRVGAPVRVKRNPQTSSGSSLDSSSMLALIGIAFVILAGIFFIKITIDSGWLTPMRQILLAAGTGLGFFLAPHLLPKAEK